MVKCLFIALVGLTLSTTIVFAQDTVDASVDKTHDEHADHSQTDQDLSPDAHAGHEMDHSRHGNNAGDHSGHNMEHGEHSPNRDDHSEHQMDHSEHDHASGAHSGTDHEHPHPVDMPGEHELLHRSDDHTDHQAHGEHHHHEDGHLMDHEGTHIMGQNFDKLPNSCSSISEDIEITVRAGRMYAKKFPGTAFAFDQQEWRVKPCSRIKWHFVNEDNVRHQFMMHGLPRYLYLQGMFHLENTGPRTVTGTMIVPAADKTYLVHCDIAQHMEKGMKAQLVVGNGSENLSSIPGLTPYTLNDVYEAEDLPKVSDKTDVGGRNTKPITQQIIDFFNKNLPFSDLALIGLLFGLIFAPLFVKVIALRI